MDSRLILHKTARFAQSTLEGEGSGHDWWHVWRVWQSAILIGRREGADLFVIELASLLHDIADWKFCGGDDSKGPRAARKWLKSLGVRESVIAHVEEIIRNISFRGARVLSKMKTLEGKVVQDADRLDALGAIGIARTFAYGGNRGRAIYDPKIKPRQHRSFAEYKKSNGPTINHFYEKLLLLKDLMNTKTARRMARARHRFMEKFLGQFYREWNSADSGQ